VPLFADAELDQAVLALRKLDAETLLLPVLLRLAVILLAARLFGILLRRVGQPTVVGEIVAGIVLGPSLFGWLLPDLSRRLFLPGFDGVPPELGHAALAGIFQILAQIGLVFLLFLIGLEFDFTHLKDQFRPALGVCLVSLAVPFALSFALAPFLHPLLEAHPEKGPVPLFGMTIFLGTALGIAALPVLGRIILEMGIQRTKLATVIITAAALGDLFGWVLLATVSSIVKANFNLLRSLELLGLTVLFCVALYFFVRPVAVRYFRAAFAKSGAILSLNSLTVLLVLLLLVAIATNLIGIFSIFGAFVLGMIFSDQDMLREAVIARMKDFVTAFFLPVFFTYTGLRTDLGTLSLATHGPVFTGLILLTIVGKFGGCALTARLFGFTWREAGIVGVSMNTLGLMGLIVINLGYDLGVIPRSLFGLLVLMAVATTAMAAPIIVRLCHGTEIEEPLKRSGFLGR
jgi:Kef-type K+ transport system membrane component KefB